MKESKLFRQFSGKETRHKKLFRIKGNFRGVGCKTVGVVLFLYSVANRGRRRWGVVAPATWRAGSSGKKGKTERRPRGTRGAAHLGRRRMERGPVADNHGGRLGQPWTATLQCFLGDGKRRRMRNSTLRCS
jgi:hypothetical protein